MGPKHLTTQRPSVAKAHSAWPLNAPLRHSPHEAAGPKEARTSSGREVNGDPLSPGTEGSTGPLLQQIQVLWTKTDTTERGKEYDTTYKIG